jgi:hypothetical protein
MLYALVFVIGLVAGGAIVYFHAVIVKDVESAAGQAVADVKAAVSKEVKKL